MQARWVDAVTALLQGVVMICLRKAGGKSPARDKSRTRQQHREIGIDNTCSRRIRFITSSPISHFVTVLSLPSTDHLLAFPMPCDYSANHVPTPPRFSRKCQLLSVSCRNNPVAGIMPQVKDAWRRHSSRQGESELRNQRVEGLTYRAGMD